MILSTWYVSVLYNFGATTLEDEVQRNKMGLPEALTFRVVCQGNVDQKLLALVQYSKCSVLPVLIPCLYRRLPEEILAWSSECIASGGLSQLVRFLLPAASFSTISWFSLQLQGPVVSLDKLVADPTSPDPLVEEVAVRQDPRDCAWRRRDVQRRPVGSFPRKTTLALHNGRR
jgi:hypothetical protein